jgi:tetratricopeptide (TPR) repeat protein
MHYLIHKPGGSAAIDKFMSLTNGNTALDQAFQQSFETTFEKMEKEVRAYIRHDSYPVTVGSFQRKIDFDTELQVSSLSEADANAYLGDLLMHGNRAESEGYLKKALALDPNHPMANASLAMLRVREGKIDEARTTLERAATANSQNYLIHYYYAFALSREGMGPSQLVSGYSAENLAKMREELNRIISSSSSIRKEQPRPRAPGSPSRAPAQSPSARSRKPANQRRSCCRKDRRKN